MPGRDGTGPRGTGPYGRRMGPCSSPVSTATGIAEEKKQNGDSTVTEVVGQTMPATGYGVGRGGKPRGCGMGRCGGSRRQ